MNIFEAMESVRDIKIAPEAPNIGITDILPLQSSGSILGATGFYNVGNAPRPLYTGYTGYGAKIPDIDRDGIPDHMDYHFGSGQW